MPNPGEQFLHKREPRLHESKPVRYEACRREGQNEEDLDLTKQKTSPRSADQIADWLSVVKRTHTGHRDDPRVLERIKKYYHREHVISPENIPESHHENQRRMAREQGYGDIEITDEMRKQGNEVVIADQKSTLDNWTDYFTSPDSDSYPMWAKYWAFTGMLKLSTYNKEKHVFNPRFKDTVAPFPDLNREALAYVIDALIKKYGETYFNLIEKIAETEYSLDRLKRNIRKAEIVRLVEEFIEADTIPAEQRKVYTIITADRKTMKVKKARYLKVKKELKDELGDELEPEREIEKLETKLIDLKQQLDDQKQATGLPEKFLGPLEEEDFGVLYATAIEEVTPAEESELAITTGEWVKYDKGSDHMPLVTALQGHGTGWCTAGESTAKAHLATGDFYVYYSHDRNGVPKVPRIAIRMEEDSIAEIRGVAPNQNMDSYISKANILEQKLEEFGNEGERSKKGQLICNGLLI